MTVRAFFDYARERHATYLRREAGGPPPWTDDPIIQTNRFTNVYRELDRTTAWFRKHVRDPMADKPEVLMATLVFRWFNRISTGEAIFCQHDLFDGATPFDMFLRDHNTHALRRAIMELVPDGPWVTGAYTINTRSAGVGLNKLDGVLKLIELWWEAHPDWLRQARRMMRHKNPWTLEQFCEWARSPCLAGFMTYEVACDLRHTRLLGRAPDVNLWGNVGPGALRGLNRIYRPDVLVNRAPPDGNWALEQMRYLLHDSKRDALWPHKWPRWELREVEHTLCEFDKYERVRLGQGRPRGGFNGRAP